MHRGSAPSWIQKYVGLKFGDKGRGPDEFDCWGLVRWVYLQEFRILLPDYLTDYKSVNDDKAVKNTVISGMSDGWTKVVLPVDGDVVLFNIYGMPIHVGLVAGLDYFLHSPEDDFSRRERLSDRMWKNRIEGFYRHERFSGHSPTASSQDSDILGGVS